MLYRGHFVERIHLIARETLCLLVAEVVHVVQRHAVELGADLDDQPAAGGVVGGTDLGDGEITAVLAFDVLVQESVLDDEFPDLGRELSHVELAIATIDGSNGQLAGYVDHGVTCEKDDPAEAGSW
ncbi:hypothetical protein HMPREF3150_01211 [Pseudomonas aeruginosa]|nr:hypothetical protein HMPREF3150_01211 [Pseudomonas aeruginosa]